jgi:hypothetical protein
MTDRIKAGKVKPALHSEAEAQQLAEINRKLAERTSKANGHATTPAIDQAATACELDVVELPDAQLAAGIAGNHRFDTGADLELDVCPTPPRPGPLLFFQRMKGSECHTFTIYSKCIFGINVHFVHGRSSPHYRNEKKCPGCRAKNAKRWKGFLHAFNVNLGQEVFLELTPHSAKSLLSQLGNRVGMRGNRIQVKRTAGDNGRLLISILTAAPNVDQLPEPKDPLESLKKFWGIDNFDPDGIADGGTHSHDFE